MQALNFTVSALEALLSYPCPAAPLSRVGFQFLADKLRQAQVFVLPDCGQLLDRGKPRPEVPGLLLRPPFPVTALEYTARNTDWDQGIYTEVKCSKRVSLAWEWSDDDFPRELRGWLPANLGPGVAVVSIPFHDQEGCWVPIATGLHLSFESPWAPPPPPGVSHFRDSMIESGRLSKAVQKANSLRGTPFVVSPETVLAMAGQVGMPSAMDMLNADTMDELNAYADLCYALACKNVDRREYGAPAALNKQRIRKGKLPLKGFHMLELNGEAGLPGGANGDARSGARSHLRRGHIRRLPENRVTWVNSTIVKGRARGFVEKAYDARRLTDAH